jgi:signal transduction histidine kinase
MALDERDKKMMSLSVPTVDYFGMREDLDRLEDTVDRLEKIVESLLELYRSERVKNWELILKEMLKEQDTKKGNRNDRKFRS